MFVTIDCNFSIWLRDWRDFWHDIVYVTEVTDDD